MGYEALLERDLTSADRILFRAGPITAASFDCPVNHSNFAGSGPLSCHYLVFPRNFTAIERHDGVRFIATPNMVVLYSPGDSYARQAVSVDGDHCDYLAIDKGSMAALMSDSGGENRAFAAGTGFRDASAPITPDIYLRQRLLFDRLRNGTLVERLEFEVSATELVVEILANAMRFWNIDQRMLRHLEASTSLRQRAQIEHAMRLLTMPGSAALSVSELARRVNLAPSSMERLFRSYTGYSVYQYTLQIRLRFALNLLLERDGDIADVACDLGFTHHSHFGRHFRRTFGITPTTYVRCARGGVSPAAKAQAGSISLGH